MLELKPTNSKSFLSKLWDKIKGFFGGAKGTASEHVAEVHADVAASIDRIQAIRGEMERLLDEELMLQVQLVLDPVLEELQDVHETSPVHGSPPFPEHIWTSKAHVWLDMSDKVAKREALVAALIEQSFDLVVDHVKDDMEMLLRYLSVEVEQLKLPPDEAGRLKTMLKSQIDPFLEKLNQLHGDYDPTNLHELMEWKEAFHEKRKAYHEEAIKQIVESLKKFKTS